MIITDQPTAAAGGAILQLDGRGSYRVTETPAFSWNNRLRIPTLEKMNETADNLVLGSTADTYGIISNRRVCIVKTR